MVLIMHEFGMYMCMLLSMYGRLSISELVKYTCKCIRFTMWEFNVKIQLRRNELS